MAKKKLNVNPWTHIWFNPRETIRKIVRYNPKFRFFVLSFLYGLPLALHTAQNLSLGEEFSSTGIVIFSLILAAFIGMLGITISTALIYWTGKWIGGEGKYQTVRTAVAWSNAPNVIVVAIWAGMIYLFRDHLFFENFAEFGHEGNDLTFVTGAMVFQAILSIWSFIILVKGLGEVQKFSAWKGVLNVLIPFFLVGVLIWVLTWIFWVCDGMPAAA